jgi:hypothetical protein
MVSVLFRARIVAWILVTSRDGYERVAFSFLKCWTSDCVVHNATIRTGFIIDPACRGCTKQPFGVRRISLTYYKQRRDRVHEFVEDEELFIAFRA